MSALGFHLSKRLQIFLCTARRILSLAMIGQQQLPQAKYHAWLYSSERRVALESLWRGKLLQPLKE